MHGILLIYTFTSTTVAVSAFTKSESTTYDVDHRDPALTSVKVIALVAVFTASCYFFFKICLRSSGSKSHPTTELPNGKLEPHQRPTKRPARVLNILKHTYHSKNYHSTCHRPTIYNDKRSLLQTDQRDVVPTAPPANLDLEYGFRAHILNFSKEDVKGKKQAQLDGDVEEGFNMRVLGFEKFGAAAYEEAVSRKTNCDYGETCMRNEGSGTYDYGDGGSGDAGGGGYRKDNIDNSGGSGGASGESGDAGGGGCREDDTDNSGGSGRADGGGGDAGGGGYGEDNTDNGGGCGGDAGGGDGDN